MNTALRLALIFALALTVACAHGSDKQLNPKDSADIRLIVTDYNMKMKWGMYDAASLYILPAERQEFIGRYEEKGDDFKIVEIAIKGVTMANDDKAMIEVEQEWYGADMVVKKERFVEYWESVDGNWMRGERITKDEYRERKKEVTEALTKKKDASEASEPTPSETELETSDSKQPEAETPEAEQ